MKYGFLCMAFCMMTAGCVVGAPQPRSKAQTVQIKIVGQKPQGCVFVAGILGDQNDSGRGWTDTWLDNIRSNAQRLGGNVVYLRTARQDGLSASDEYFRDFYVNGVQYGALVYKCP